MEGDALDTLFGMEMVPDRVVGNLPYNVGSQIIGRMIERSVLPQMMVFTLQKEVGERMTSGPGDEEYSSFSILTQIDYDNAIAFTIGPGSFYPAPNVESAVVLMRRKEKSLVDASDRDLFIRMVRALFAKRRKTIRNNLLTSQFSAIGKECIERAFAEAGLTGSERAEVLSFETLVNLMVALKGIRQ